MKVGRSDPFRVRLGRHGPSISGSHKTTGPEVPSRGRTFVLRLPSKACDGSPRAQSEAGGLSMGKVRTRAIREASSIPVLPFSERGPQAGPPPTTDIYLCGECGIVLAQDLPLSVLGHSTVRCPSCGAINELGSWLPRPRREALKVCPSCRKRRRHPGQQVCGFCSSP